MPATRRPGRRAVSERAADYGDFEVRERLDRLIRVLGATQTADLVGVSKSQPARWRDGAERVSIQNLHTIMDLDYVISRLLLNWDAGVIPHWLNGHNPHVGGRPIEVLKRRGAMALLPALDADDHGAYA